MIRVLKDAFDDIRFDLIKDILNIQGEFNQILFSWVFFLILILLVILVIKNGIQVYHLKKINKTTRKRIERKYFITISGKDKNKEFGNI